MTDSTFFICREVEVSVGDLKRAVVAVPSSTPIDRAVDAAVAQLVKRADPTDVLLDVIAARWWVDPVNNPLGTRGQRGCSNVMYLYSYRRGATAVVAGA